jgi:hypothetical protein
MTPLPGRSHQNTADDGPSPIDRGIPGETKDVPRGKCNTGWKTVGHGTNTQELHEAGADNPLLKKNIELTSFNPHWQAMRGENGKSKKCQARNNKTRLELKLRFPQLHQRQYVTREA